MSSLEQLRKFSIIVADTADSEALKLYKPTDATTNPSLILNAAKMERYQELVKEAVKYGAKAGKTEDEQLSEAMDYLCVLFGLEILKIVPGRVSTEIDSRLSFDTAQCIKKALHIIDLYEKKGIKRERILIKVPATWEGIQAAKILEKKHDVKCNMTLVFSLPQAVACAEAGVTLISPFVARVLDWFVAHTEKKSYEPYKLFHPGVISVRNIYNYYKKYGYKTEIMAASLSNIDEVKAVAGCDFLTMTPDVLKGLLNDHEPFPAQLTVKNAQLQDIKKIDVDEPTFRWMLNEDAMATDKLSEGIRNFSVDTVKLIDLIRNYMYA